MKSKKRKSEAFLKFIIHHYVYVSLLEPVLFMIVKSFKKLPTLNIILRQCMKKSWSK